MSGSRGRRVGGPRPVEEPMNKLSVRDLDLGGEPRGKRVLVRVDYNVPLAGDRVADDTRIRATLPTLNLLREAGARIVLMSHLGRPKGRVKPELSLAPVAKRLGELLGHKVVFAPDCVGEKVEGMVNELGRGDVILLENLRFHSEEEANDPGFAAALARLGDVYVNDAFGAAHRAHASVVGVTEHLQPAAAGFLLGREVEVLAQALNSAERPFVTILGGAKISGKIDVITNLLPRVDRMLVGGAMMFTFLEAKGIGVGKSLVEKDRVGLAGEILAKAGDKLVLPVDCRIASSPDRSASPGHVVNVDEIPESWCGVDIGPETIGRFGGAMSDARTVLWNGPMGIFEVDAFSEGTYAVAQFVAGCTGHGAMTIVGGGDSVAAVSRAGLADEITHVSTGGGASLEFLEGKTLPGVAALTDASTAPAPTG